MIVAVALAAAALNPIEFFRGRSHGEGTLKVLFQKPKRISVDSEGRVQPDGALLLTQVIHESGKRARTREWRMRQTSPTRFDGTLTDAAGPVRVELVGQRIRINYTGKDHLAFEQWLTLAGPRQVNNRMRVKRFGITVAQFNEVIRKLD